MILKAYILYISYPDFSCTQADRRTDGSTRGSTKGSRGPKKKARYLTPSSSTLVGAPQKTFWPGNKSREK